MAEHCWVCLWWLKCVYPTTFLLSVCFLFVISSFYSTFRLLPSVLLFFFFLSIAAKNQTALSPAFTTSFCFWWRQGFVELLDTVGWPQGLLAFAPLLLPCLSACLAELPHHTRAQTTKARFAASEWVPVCPGIPTGGENSLPHCYALITCQVPFLFCSLVFRPPFPLIFSLCLYHSSFLCWQHTLGVFTLHSVKVPQWPFYFLTLFILDYFHELCCHLCCFVNDLSQHAGTQLDLNLLPEYLLQPSLLALLYPVPTVVPSGLFLCMK